MSNYLLLHILALAERIEPDRDAVWEWFFRTPITPYGKTAFELGVDDRGDIVVAFLERAIADGAAGSARPPVPSLLDEPQVTSML